MRYSLGALQGVIPHGQAVPNRVEPDAAVAEGPPPEGRPSTAQHGAREKKAKTSCRKCGQCSIEVRRTPLQRGIPLDTTGMIGCCPPA